MNNLRKYSLKSVLLIALICSMQMFVSLESVCADEDAKPLSSEVAVQSNESGSSGKLQETKPASKSGYLSGATESQDAIGGYMSGESAFPSFLKITLALIAVIAGIYLTLALLKKTMGRKVSNGGKASAIQVIETCYLAPKRSISLVRIGSRGALLSVSDNTIATLLELSAAETSEIVEMVDANAATPDFRETLHKAKKKIIDLSSFAMKTRDHGAVEQLGVK